MTTRDRDEWTSVMDVVGRKKDESISVSCDTGEAACRLNVCHTIWFVSMRRASDHTIRAGSIFRLREPLPMFPELCIKSWIGKVEAVWDDWSVVVTHEYLCVFVRSGAGTASGSHLWRDKWKRILRLRSCLSSLSLQRPTTNLCQVYVLCIYPETSVLKSLLGLLKVSYVLMIRVVLYTVVLVYIHYYFCLACITIHFLACMHFLQVL